MKSNPIEGMKPERYKNDATRLVSKIILVANNADDDYWFNRIFDEDRKNRCRGTIKIVGAEMAEMLLSGKATPTRPLSPELAAQIVEIIKDVDWEDIINGDFDYSQTY